MLKTTLMEYNLTLNNKKIWEFYDEHKNLSFERMNLLFIEILDNLLRNTNPTLDANIAVKLLDQMKSMQYKMDGIEESMSDIGTNMSKNQTDIANTFTLKFLDFKRDYMEDMKLILSNNASEKVAPLIKDHNENLLDKTRIMINDIIPKSQTTLFKHIENSLTKMQSSINNDTNTLMKTSLNRDILDNFIKSLDEKFSTTLVSSQNVFNSILTSTEHRLDTKLTDIKDISSSNNSTQDTLCSNINDLLKKMENSSAKGKISENILFNVIHSLYPTAQIESVGTQKETGDIIMRRRNKPNILFENKNYDKNINQDEVRKFLRDIEHQNCSGIMLAQHFGITNKNNFEIEIHKNNVLVYLHKVEYDADKIKAAIDIIDYFKETLIDIDDTDGDIINISKELLDDINKDYQNFINSKLAHIKTIKDFNQKLLLQIDEIKIPALDHYLSKLYASSASKENTCEYCNYSAKNVRALTAHHRGCAIKKQHDLDKKNRIQNTIKNMGSSNAAVYNPNKL